MKDELETGYATPPFPQGEASFKRLAGPGRLKPNTGKLRPVMPFTSVNEDKPSMEDHMKEINQTASLSASQCKIIGHLYVFSSRVRRGIALKQRFQPGDGAHPLFFTI